MLPYSLYPSSPISLSLPFLFSCLIPLPSPPPPLSFTSIRLSLSF